MPNKMSTLNKSRVISRLLPVTAVCFALTVSASTTGENKLFVTGENNYWKATDIVEGTGSTTVTVDLNTKYQKWMGFAGTVNEAGWDALKVLDPSERDKAIKLLFDKKDGLGLTWVRIPIGASDYALDRYTLNETVDDTLMKNFSIARDKACLIQYIKAAQAINPKIHFWASAWTPPTWMKEGAVAGSNGYDGGTMKNQPKYLAANALYTAKFCEAYKAEGIPISFVFPQNEPGYCQNYPSCGWGRYRTPDPNPENKTGTEYLSTYVANYLEDTLKIRCPDTKIWFGTLSNYDMAQGTDGHWNRAKTNCGKSMIEGVGGQWNCTPIARDAANNGYLAMCSEHKCGNYPWNTSNIVHTAAQANENTFLPDFAPNNYAYAVESWGLFNKWIDSCRVNVYSAWNMVLDTVGKNLDVKREWPQNALLSVNRQQKKLNITPYYYALRHLSQYVDSGAVRVGTNNPSTSLAFQNPDGSIVTVVHNAGTSDAQASITVSGKTYKMTIPKKGWATLAIGLKPVGTKDNARNQSALVNGLRVTNLGDAYKVSLPSSTNGRVELLTLSGRVLETRAIPQGCSEVTFSKSTSHSGMLLVRAVYGNEIQTSRLFNAQ
jgi:glucosylceramidase